MKKASILIANSHKLIRESISLVIGAKVNFQVVAETDCGDKAIDLIEKLSPDIVIVDVDIQGVNFQQFVNGILRRQPSIKIISLSSSTDFGHAKQIFESGIMGILTKYASGTDLISCLREVNDGRRYMCNHIKQDFLTHFLNKDMQQQKLNRLTKREQQIVSFINKGLSSKEIASVLSLAVKTVEAHRYNIFKKLEIKKVTSLVNYTKHKTIA